MHSSFSAEGARRQVFVSMNQVAGTMGTGQSKSGVIGMPFYDANNDDEAQEFKVLSAQEAQVLQAGMPKLSLWSVLWLQLVAGFTVIAIASFWSGYAGVMSSALAGVMAAWVPSAVFVWRMAAQADNKAGALIPLARLLFWEFVKIGCAVVFLVMAVLWVHPLVWQALLAGFVVTVKAYGIACWLLLNRKQTGKELINGC
ncbi:hypothetical protein CUZ56_00989 [Saezia sanguinis]|uniref:ATP synthase protein I n=2 Tax=Saezia sanguinis TaxID=1965230 RepID=A0A433SE76_9BURK|nr:hypothetical protein CUZ56_00989 [Saezia sanguinis]